MSDEAPNDRRHELDATERRVLGVLVEKAKTTPSAYPLSLNALATGCNQKSNRFPQLELGDEQVERAIDSLRQKGAVSIVQGDSRVERYRHLAYDWLGVQKAELAVMAELLLRGAQTIGELRGRAARMEPIKGLAELTPVLATLVEKRLVEYLTPPGRGAIVSHTFFSDSERERTRRDLGLAGGSAPTPRPAAPTPPPAAPAAADPPPATAPASGPATDWAAEIAALRAEFQDEIASLRDEIEALRGRVEG